MHFPITGSNTNDFVLIVLAVIGGAALALKADVKWGWVIVAAAVFWAVTLLRPYAGH